MIVGDSPALVRVLDLADKVAASPATVLIAGESGTGKELLAARLHARSRAGRPFLAVNCAALPRDLFESELFGHERGAFTGAIARKVGRFEAANGGTLLLDEVSEIDLGLQAKLLRVLQEGEVDRIGSTRPVPVDVRVIATTNRRLDDMVQAGTFRADLFYRLATVRLTLPPLRERQADIPALALYFVDLFGGPGLAIGLDAMQRLLLHDWPGNVRELQAAMQRACLLAAGRDRIVAADLLLDGDPDQAAGDGPRPFVEHLVGFQLHQVERLVIEATLRATAGNQTRAAQLLGCTPRTIRSKLADYRAGVVPITAPASLLDGDRLGAAARRGL